MKKPVAKKKAAPRRKPSVPAHHKWTVYWIRVLNGDEYISYAKPMKTGIMMMDPTIVATMSNSYGQEQMILAPYGMMSKEPGVFLQKEHLVHYNEASDTIKALYEVSISTSWEFTQKSFDDLVRRSTETAIRISQSDEEPSADAVMIGRASELRMAHENAMEKSSENVADAVDRLMQLAEKAGKGKKV